MHTHTSSNNIDYHKVLLRKYLYKSPFGYSVIISCGSNMIQRFDLPWMLNVIHCIFKHIRNDTYKLY